MQANDKETPKGALVETIMVSPFMMNSMIIACRHTRKAAVIDPGDEATRILARVKALDLEVTHILLTHGHLDHIAATGDMKQATGAPIYLHREDVELYKRLNDQARTFGLPSQGDMPEVDVFVEEHDEIEVGDLKFSVLHTPGHSPGSVCYYLTGQPSAEDELVRDGFAVCGDVLFAGSIGRTDLWGGSYGTLMSSIGRKLMSLPDKTKIFSGHGPVTTVGRERLSNPFAHDFLARLV